MSHEDWFTIGMCPSMKLSVGVSNVHIKTFIYKKTVVTLFWISALWFAPSFSHNCIFLTVGRLHRSHAAVWNKFKFNNRRPTFQQLYTPSFISLPNVPVVSELVLVGSAEGHHSQFQYVF